LHNILLKIYAVTFLLNIVHIGQKATSYCEIFNI